jgi:hypothetical protein
MKNRFYGDKKDYIKYGLLDILSADYRSIGINWCLTDDHHGNQNHGHDLNFLNDENWQRRDSRIFELLKQRVKNGQRSVIYCRIDRVIPIGHEVLEQLPDNVAQEDYRDRRLAWHSRAKEKLVECDLVFFDPDKGVIDKLPDNPSPISHSEYCLASEEVKGYNWCDWLVIQFLQPKKSRYNQLFFNPITQTSIQLNKKIIAFISGPVAFLYVTEKIKMNILQQIFKKWDTKISTYILVG